MKTLRVSFLCGAAFVLTAFQSPAQGTLLGLFADTGVPDLAGLSLNVTYNPSLGKFDVAGTAGGYVNSAGTSLGIAGTAAFNLSANISSSGYLNSGSTLAITGELDGGVEQTLLSGDLLTGSQGVPAGAAPVGSAYDYWDYTDSGEFQGTQFAFTFTVTGGALAADFGGVNAQGVVELFPWGSTPFGDFTTSYDNGGGGSADVFPVPEPSSLLLLIMGGAMVWMMVRHSRHSLFQREV